AAVLVGFNDGVFPMRLAEDPILNDDDREWLRVRGLRIAPPTRERSLDESLLVYIALTRASERLAITYSMSDTEGRELGPSSYVEALRQACPDLTVGRIDESSASRSAGDVWVAKDLRRRLFSEFRDRPALNVDDQSRRSLWNGVYEWVRGALTRDVLGLRIAASLRDRIEETLSAMTIQELHRGTLRTNVTQLESFACCPFQHFARFVLRLAPRAEAVVEPLDVGQIHHAILEDFTAGVARDRIAFGDLDDASLLARLSVSCGRVADMASRDVVLSEARGAYLLRRSGATLGRLLRAQRNVARAGRAKPWRTELSFGMDEDDGMAPLDLLTPRGRNVLLRGYIDRVDLIELADRYLGVVVDYKRTRDRNRHVDLSEVYHGVTLQLPAYLLALQARGETLAGRPIEPIAGLYVVTEGSYDLVAHPSAQPDRDPSASTMPQPKGILQAEQFGELDEVPIGRSRHYRAFRKKDGTFGHLDATDVATAQEFAATLAHTKRRLGELADGVIDGNVRVNPCRLEGLNPCTWCAMVDVCRFEIGVCGVRFLGGFSSRSEVLQKMVQEAS
ncbi:MAG: PD-(D/E)XK nuclease family protein, partial [Planctomycetota bacterium]